MGDIFTSNEAQNLLQHKHVVILGDSNFRSIYKDIISLLQSTDFMMTKDAKAKGELSCKGDTLLEGGRKGTMHNGTSYREKRIYKTGKFKIEFEFITRVFNNHVEGILKAIRDNERPDVLIINSALWDMTRYGANCVKEYKDNMRRLFDRVNSWMIPSGTLVIWAAAPPISGSPSGALLVPEVDFLKDSLRMDVICANAFAADLAQVRGLDFVDLHFFLRRQIHRRVKDGIHWDNTALRRVVNILFTHISEAWGVDLPRRVDFMGEPIVGREINRSEARDYPAEKYEADEEDAANGRDTKISSHESRFDGPLEEPSTAASSEKSNYLKRKISSSSPTIHKMSRPSTSTQNQSSSLRSSMSNSSRPSPKSRLTPIPSRSSTPTPSRSSTPVPSRSSTPTPSRSTSSRSIVLSSTDYKSSAAPRHSSPAPRHSSPAPRSNSSYSDHPRSSASSWDFASDDIGEVGFSTLTRSQSTAQISHHITYGRQEMMQMDPYSNIHSRHHPYARGGGGHVGPHQGFPYARYPGPMGRGWGARGSHR